MTEDGLGTPLHMVALEHAGGLGETPDHATATELAEGFVTRREAQ